MLQRMLQRHHMFLPTDSRPLFSPPPIASLLVSRSLMLARRAVPLLRSALPTLRRRIPQPLSDGTRAPIHLPVIAAGVSKIIATAGIKKIAVNSVVRKLGARRVLADLRDAIPCVLDR